MRMFIKKLTIIDLPRTVQVSLIATGPLGTRRVPTNTKDFLLDLFRQNFVLLLI
jgi:hypothetical protein